MIFVCTCGWQYQNTLEEAISIASALDQIRQLDLLESKDTAQYKLNMCGTSKVTLPPVGDNVSSKRDVQVIV